MKPSLFLIFLLLMGRLVGACSASTSDPSVTDGGSGEAGLDAAGVVGDGATNDATGDSATCKLVRPYSTKTPPCNACAERECCALINTCLNDDSCDNGYVNCILACALTSPADAAADADVDAGIAACESACGTQYPAARAEYVALTGCVDSKCASTCN